MSFNYKKALLPALILLLSVFYSEVSAQTISYYKDVSKSITIENLDTLSFKPYDKIINDGVNHANYWIKIEGLKKIVYSVQIPNSRIIDVECFRNKTSLKPLNRERFNTFSIAGPDTILIKVNATKESYIPIKLKSINDYQRVEKASFLFIGFYIGFVILIFALNMLYAFSFKDRTYTYYAFFLLSAALGILISDGIFSYLHLPNKWIDILETIMNIAIGGFAILFMNRFLQLHNYFPKFRLIPFTLLLLSVIVTLLFLTTNNFYFYVILECLVFLALAPYWVGAILLFNKNNFMKISVIAYSVILFFSMDFYLTKLFGISLMHSTANQLKTGSILEMCVLSVAVIYRMKTVHVKNKEMRNALDVYTKEVKTLSAKIKKGETQTTESVNLSFRETEIIELISQGNTNKEIANTLSISENTVKYHVKNIYTKLSIKSRKEVLKVIKQ